MVIIKKSLLETYKIEIQEFLARVVNVDADSIDEAFSIIKENYKKTDIVLDYNDFIEVDFVDINSQSKKDEKNELVNEIIEYLFETEKNHFEEFETEPENHIFKKLLRLKELNSD